MDIFLDLDVDDVDEKVKKVVGKIEILRRKSLGFGLHHLHQTETYRRNAL